MSNRRNIRRRLHKAQQDRCFYCGKLVPFSDSTVDHYIPLDLGGSENIANCRMACAPCNAAKGDNLPAGMTVDEWYNLVGHNARTYRLLRILRAREAKG